MMKKSKRILVCAACLLALLGLGLLAPQLLSGGDRRIPGLSADERVLLRIWLVDAPGGGQSWLTGQLRAWEKQHPAVTTYLRQASTADLADPDAVLPDIVLYTPGDVTAPDALFLPLSGEAVHSGLLQAALLRSGKWQGKQYGLPLCWGAWVLGIDSSLDPESAATPAPTTLLGKPAATAHTGATPTPGYPLPAASKADRALQSAPGAALLTLSLLLDPLDRPPLPDGFAQQDATAVYEGFRRRAWATAMLTTGQVTALNSALMAGSGFPFRVMTPQYIVTDQVLLASLTPDAPEEAARLLTFLTSIAAQEALAAQGLFTVRNDLSLYVSGTYAEVEAASRQGLAALNAFLSPQEAESAAWRVWQGTASFDEALLPLL